MGLANTYQSKRGAVRVWQCDICGRLFEWSKESSWYGSLRAEDDCDWSKMTIACSEACKRKAAKAVGGGE
jgi:hypothetical protein